jgi:hypothetical protein
VINPATDLSYSILQDESLCVAKWMEQDAPSSCGASSRARLGKSGMAGTTAVRRIEVPVAEVARDGRNIRMRVTVYKTGDTTQLTTQWLNVDLVAGKVTRLPAPSDW